MKADAKTKSAVQACLQRCAELYSKRDLDGFLELFAPDADLVLIGSGEDEKRLGLAEIKAQAERDWSQSDAMSMEFGWTSISAAGPVAWVAADISVHGIVDGERVTFAGRVTAVLEQRGDRWLFVQWHFSRPAADQAQGESWPTPIEAIASAVQSERPDLRSHAAPDGTVTLLFSDIEGSTALTERLGDLRWFELLRGHNGLVRRQVQAHGGFEVKNQGDGFMLAFGSARRALQCAIAIQRAVAAHDWSEPQSTTGGPISVRIGLHTGEAVRDAEDFYGHHVNLAARIADEARGGEILVSALLKELTETAGDFAFGEEREAELKGLSRPQSLYEVRWRE